jgi:hypothetical protein
VRPPDVGVRKRFFGSDALDTPPGPKEAEYQRARRPPRRPGKRYAALLTLAVNCSLVGANPFDYFNDIYEHLARGWPKSRAAELMPQAWIATQQKAEKVDGEGGLSADHD